MMNLVNRLQALHHLLNDGHRSKKDLFQVKDNKIMTPIAQDTLSLFSYRSKRRDKFRNMAVIEGILNEVKAAGQFRGINHIIS